LNPDTLTPSVPYSDSVELREFEAQLKAAYTNKERLAQMAEKEALKYDLVARDAELSRVQEEERRKTAEWEKKRDHDRLLLSIRYQQELDLQLEVSGYYTYL